MYLLWLFKIHQANEPIYVTIDERLFDSFEEFLYKQNTWIIWIAFNYECIQNEELEWEWEWEMHFKRKCHAIHVDLLVQCVVCCLPFAIYSNWCSKSMDGIMDKLWHIISHCHQAIDATSTTKYNNQTMSNRQTECSLWCDSI